MAEKTDGRSLDDVAILAEVARIIDTVCGYPGSRVTLATRLVEDAGVAGDDGGDLMAALDARFALDWTGFDMGVHFGNEGLGVPPPWQLAGNCVMFEPQTITVGQLVAVIRVGRWSGTPLVPVGPVRRARIYLASWATVTLVAGLALAAMFAALRRMGVA